MSDPMVDRLVKKRDHAVNQIEAIKEAAIDADRDLDDKDLEAIETYKRSVSEYDKQLATIGDDLRMDDEARAQLARVAPSIASAETRYRSDGELVWDLLHQNDDDARRRLGSALKRAADHMGSDATVTTPTAGDLKALYIAPKVGPVIRPDNATMPFAAALGLRPMPSGSAFERPFISDPNFDDGVALQTAEKAELASEKFDADVDVLKRKTLGGYLNVSQQMLTWNPGSLTVIVDQMRDRLTSKIESYFVSQLATSTGKVDLAANAEAGATLKALYAASAAVFASTNELASWVVMGPLGWARLGGLTDAAGRPMFPNLAPSNANGTASAASFGIGGGVAGLTPVVTPKITNDEFWVGNSNVLEGYVYYYPLLESIEASVLGRQIAVAADVVAHTPTPRANSAVLVGAP